MKFAVFFIVYFIILPNVVISVFDILPIPNGEVNITHWREQRRKKRFILFDYGGVCKIGFSISYPIDLSDEVSWRQMTFAHSVQYQFPLPGRPVYWWNKWSTRNLPDRPAMFTIPENPQDYKDEAQEFIYRFAENLMERWGMKGRTCVQRLICENAQIHLHHGLFSEILHRILQPQRNLNSDYTEAWRLGRKGLDCQAVYPEATKCLLDDYLHVREEVQQQHFGVEERGQTCNLHSPLAK